MATIRELQAKFTASAQGMRSQINRVKKDISGIGDNTSKAVAKANRSLDTMQEETRKLEKELKDTGNTKAFDSLRNSIAVAKDEIQRTGQVSEETMRDMQRATRLAKRDFEDLGDDGRISLNQIEKALTDVRQDLQRTQTETDDTSESMKELGSNFSSIIGGVIAGGGIAGVVSKALDRASLDTSIELSFDVPEDQIDDVKDSVKEVTAVIGDQESALEGVRRQFALNSEASVEENQKVIESASMIARAYQGIDFTELIQETNEIANELDTTNEEAIALTNALLKVGFPPEQLDIIAEYGQQLNNAGYNAEEIQAIFEAGVNTGTWNIDNLLDGLKEGRIRLSEFGQEVPDAIGDLLEGTELSTEQMQEWGKAVAEGGEEGKDAFQEVAEALAEVEDDTTRNALGVEIFGTMWEDQGENIIDTITEMDEYLVDAEDNQQALNDALETMEEDPVTNVRKAMNELFKASGPVLDEIADIVNKLAEWVRENPRITSSITGVATGVGILGGALSTISPIVKPLISLFGGGKRGLGGTLLRLVSRAGPVGLGVSIFGALAGAIVGVTKATEKSTEEIEESFSTREQEIDKTDKLIDQYEKLQDKNKLSTDEVLRYMDIMEELEKAENEETIEKLRKEQENLLEKSGMTNDEMEDFLGLNDQIIERTPDAVQVISEQGNAYAGAVEQLREMTDLQRQQLENDLYVQLNKGSKEYKNNLEQSKRLQEEINELNVDRQVTQLQLNEKIDNDRALNERLNELQQQRNDATGFEKRLIEQNIAETERQILENQKDYGVLEKQSEKIGEQITEKQESLQVTKDEITAYENMLGQYEAMLLFNAGITDEKGNQYNSIEDANAGLRKQLEHLAKQKRNGELTNDEYQKQVEKIMQQSSKVQDVQEESKELNEILGLDIDKDVNVDTDLDREYINLPATVYKKVKISTEGGLNVSAGAGLAHGTSYHTGGLAILGDGRGANAGSEMFQTPKGNIGFSPPFDTLMNLPRGTKVWSARETKRILSGITDNALNLVNRYANGIGNRIRGFSDGGIINNKQLSWVAEGGWAESIISHDPNKKARSYRLWEETGDRLGFTNKNYNESEKLRLLERIARAVENETGKEIVMDSRTVGRLVEPYVTQEQNRIESTRRRFRG